MLRTRSSAESHLYMDLHPCSCGCGEFSRQATIQDRDGELVTVYTGLCPQCGGPRQFEFILPSELVAPPQFGEVVPSAIIDPGEYLAVSDRLARAVPADPSSLTDDERPAARIALETAVCALDEVLKFVPMGQDRVPDSAFFTERGRGIHADEPGRFRRARLEAVRDRYRVILDQYARSAGS